MVSLPSFLLLCAASAQTVSFYNTNERGEIQRVTFDTEQVKRIFHGSFHKVKVVLVPKDGDVCGRLVTEEVTLGQV